MTIRIAKRIVKSVSSLLTCLLLSSCTTNACEPNQTALSNKDASSDATITSRDTATLKKSDAQTQEVQLESGSKQQPKEISKMTKGQQITHCKEDLAKQFDVEVDQVIVLTTRPVTWSSGALGCPEQSKAYTQAQVPGRVIVLGVGELVVRYHTAVNETPFLCPNGRAESSVTQPGDL